MTFLFTALQDAYVICKIYQKGGLGPQNGAQYGALFNEEEWDNIDEMFVESQPVAHQISFENVQPGDVNNIDAVSLSVPRDLLVNFVPQRDSSKCLLQNTVRQPSKNGICVGPSAVDALILTDYVPPGTIGSSAAICMTTPGNPFPLSTSTAGPLVADISPDIDVLSLLNSFTENMDMPPVKNNPAEVLDIWPYCFLLLIILGFNFALCSIFVCTQICLWIWDLLIIQFFCTREHGLFS